MSAKDYGLSPVKINDFVHSVFKLQHDYLTETQEASSSLATELSNLVSKSKDLSRDTFQQIMLPRIHSWGGPWKWVYIREELKPVLTQMVNHLNKTLPPQSAGYLPQGVNASNLVSAMILVEALNQKLVFRATHIEASFGYRIAVKKAPSIPLKS